MTAKTQKTYIERLTEAPKDLRAKRAELRAALADVDRDDTLSAKGKADKKQRIRDGYAYWLKNEASLAWYAVKDVRKAYEAELRAAATEPSTTDQARLANLTAEFKARLAAAPVTLTGSDQLALIEQLAERARLSGDPVQRQALFHVAAEPLAALRGSDEQGFRASDLLRELAFDATNERIAELQSMRGFLDMFAGDVEREVLAAERDVDPSVPTGFLAPPSPWAREIIGTMPNVGVRIPPGTDEAAG